MTRRISAVCLAAAALTALAPPRLAAQAKGTWVLQDARVVPVSGPAIEHGTVIVRDGLIEAVGSGLTAPADGWVIDCKGLTIYPGLVDGLSNWGLTNTPPATAAAAGGRGGGRGGVAVTTAAPAAAAQPQAQPQSHGPEDRPSNTAYLKAAESTANSDFK